jgi:hypothetical protein
VTALGKEAADRLLALYRAMTRIRVAEKHLAELFAAGDVPDSSTSASARRPRQPASTRRSACNRHARDSRTAPSHRSPS